ncbi:MAG: hypothetical protein J7K87_02165 [Candidatus Aenigmarchaeota archaeon]|nr:hypothetical protein [Candidatus Aenigmarchaeota archaeon]
MPWKLVEGSPESIGYSNLPDDFRYIFRDTLNKKIKNVTIPLENDGKIHIDRKIFGASGEIHINPTEEQKDALLESIPGDYYNIARHSESYAQLTLFGQFEYNGKKFDLNQSIRYDYGGFKIIPILPEEVTKGKNYELGEFTGRKGFDEKRWNLAMKAVKKFEELGFSSHVVDKGYVRQVCSLPKKVNEEEAENALKYHGGRIGFYAENKTFSGETVQILDMDIYGGTGKIDASLWVSGDGGGTNLYELVGEMLDRMEISIKEPVTLMKRYSREFNVGIVQNIRYLEKRLKRPIENFIESKEKKKRNEFQAIRDELRKNDVIPNNAESCLLFIDEGEVKKKAKERTIEEE